MSDVSCQTVPLSSYCLLLGTKVLTSQRCLHGPVHDNSLCLASMLFLKASRCPGDWPCCGPRSGDHLLSACLISAVLALHHVSFRSQNVQPELTPYLFISSDWLLGVGNVRLNQEDRLLPGSCEERMESLHCRCWSDFEQTV